MLSKPELSAGPMGHLSLYKGFTFTFKSIIAKITLYQLKTNVNARLTNKAASDALPRGHSEIPRITSITKTKTLSFLALNMSEHNASFERESLLKYQIFFKWFLFIAVAVAGSCFRPKLYFIRTRLISISETAYFSP